MLSFRCASLPLRSSSSDHLVRSMGIEESTDGFASRLRAGTRYLHIRAERSGITHALLLGQLARREQRRLLRMRTRNARLTSKRG